MLGDVGGRLSISICKAFLDFASIWLQSRDMTAVVSQFPNPTVVEFDCGIGHLPDSQGNYTGHLRNLTMSGKGRKEFNEKGSKVEADVALCPLLSLFRREENRDGDTYVPNALHNY